MDMKFDVGYHDLKLSPEQRALIDARYKIYMEGILNRIRGNAQKWKGIRLNKNETCELARYIEQLTSESD